MQTWFAHPAFLWTLLALPVCWVLVLFAYIRRRQLTARLASALLLRKSVLVQPRWRRLKTMCVLTGLMLVGIAAAGPQWGLDPSAQQRKGRDVIIVIDLSRSMSAEQPSRRERAVRALRDLADSFQEHGGNRVAVVAFASQAQLLFPLTQDYDHLRHVLTQIDNDDIGGLHAEKPVSGTRIGAALKLAVDSIDPSRANRPIIVLLSDGHDPADDKEWQLGVQAASAKKIRIHTVGIGDPDADATIPAGAEPLLYDGKPVLTRLYETPLKEIASGTDGVYLPAHTKRLPLGAFVQHLLDADELREETPTDEALPVYQLRYAWFLFPAVLLFMLAMLVNEGPSLASRERKRPTAKVARTSSPRRARVAAVMLAGLAIVGVSAADPATPDAILRQANDAFARQDYEAAIKLYDDLEGLTPDPGLVSFNKAAAHYRLRQARQAEQIGRIQSILAEAGVQGVDIDSKFPAAVEKLRTPDEVRERLLREYDKLGEIRRDKQAIDCYRRCLQDDEAPAERRARAHFDLGNALLEYADDNPLTLAEAATSYRACLDQPNLPAKLRADARHNLELAQLLWLKHRDKLPEDQKDPKSPPKYPDPDDRKDEGAYEEFKPTKDYVKQERPDAPGGSKSKSLQSAGLQVLPDNDQVVPASEEATLATLEREARRIAAARRQQRQAGSAPLATKDW
jgi:Ca-activated chloride channel family protein